MSEAQIRYATGQISDVGLEADRAIEAIINSEIVALDGHIVRTAGIDTSDYEVNSQLLFAHDQESLPVGRGTRVWKDATLLRGRFQFATADEYPFADTVYKMIRGQYLQSVSMSWFPIEYRSLKDRKNPDGLEFIRSKLLEVSVVPVPSNPQALITARDAGIDVRPIREWAARVLDGVTMSEIRSLALSAHRQLAPTIHQGVSMPHPVRSGDNWKCGASRNLPLSEEGAWDGPAAEKSVFEACRIGGDKPDLGKARKAFLAYDESNPKERGSYKLPFAKVVEGRLVAMASGIRAAASRLPQTDIPDNVKDSARAVIDHYEGKMKNSKDGRGAPKIETRGLYAVAQLAYLLAQAGYIKDAIEDEEEREGDDGSTNPENMAIACQALGKALVEMTVEEVGELLTGVDADGASEAMRSVGAVMKRAKLSKDDKEAAEAVHDHCARSHRMLRAHIDHFKDEDLSDEDNRALMMDSAEGIHDHCVASARCVRDFIDGQTPKTDGDGKDRPAGKAKDGNPEPATVDGKDGARSVEERRKQAAKRQAHLLIHGA